MNGYKCDSYCILKDERGDFIRWLVEKLAPVIMGSKPAELLSFPKQNNYWIEGIDNIEKYIGKCKRVKYKSFHTNNSIKILFYNPETLNLTLKEKRNIRFLKSIGYPKEYDLDKYLKIIMDKMKTGSIPHEVGVFLGYPLKDVIGFFGHPSLKLTKINGWRIYGDPTVSDKKLHKFIEDKNKIKAMLKSIKPEEILLSV